MDQSKMDVTIEQWILLKIISENQDISQRLLAGFSLRDPASITRSLKILEQKQFITKSPTGKRQYMLNLSSKGKTFIDQHLPLIDSLRKQSLDNLKSSEIETLMNLLTKIQNNFK
jgi:DNA-binding MarR family transcriptional regulator